jgi:hypothetical protein
LTLVPTTGDANQGISLTSGAACPTGTAGAAVSIGGGVQLAATVSPAAAGTVTVTAAGTGSGGKDHPGWGHRFGHWCAQRWPSVSRHRWHFW